MSSRSPKHGFPHSKRRKQCLKYRVLIVSSTHKALFIEWRNKRIWTNFITSGQILARGDLIIEGAANTRQKEQRVLHTTKRKLGFHLEYLLHRLHNEECSSSMNGDVHGHVSILVRANLEESFDFCGDRRMHRIKQRVLCSTTRKQGTVFKCIQRRMRTKDSFIEWRLGNSLHLGESISWRESWSYENEATSNVSFVQQEEYTALFANSYYVAHEQRFYRRTWIIHLGRWW
jgi:hypothetical protein